MICSRESGTKYYCAQVIRYLVHHRVPDLSLRKLYLDALGKKEQHIPYSLLTKVRNN